MRGYKNEDSSTKTILLPKKTGFREKRKKTVKTRGTHEK